MPWRFGRKSHRRGRSYRNDGRRKGMVKEMRRSNYDGGCTCWFLNIFDQYQTPHCASELLRWECSHEHEVWEENNWWTKTKRFFCFLAASENGFWRCLSLTLSRDVLVFCGAPPPPPADAASVPAALCLLALRPHMCACVWGCTSGRALRSPRRRLCSGGIKRKPDYIMKSFIRRQRQPESLCGPSTSWSIHTSLQMPESIRGILCFRTNLCSTAFCCFSSQPSQKKV